MDYQPPLTLCVRSAEPSAVPGFVILDLASPWTENDPVVVSQGTYDFITGGRYNVLECPPNYPNFPGYEGYDDGSE